MTPAFVYRATIEHVVDGDTYDLIVDLGFRVAVRIRVRLNGVDAPEVRTPEGRALRDELRATLTGAPAVVRTAKSPGDKYGRWLADIQLADRTDLATILLSSGKVVDYHGGKKQ